MSIYTVIPGSIDTIKLEDDVEENTTKIADLSSDFSGIDLSAMIESNEINTEKNIVLADSLKKSIYRTELKRQASDAEADDYFGHSVSIDGDYCIVGAYHEDTGASNAGAAYVFHRTGINTWDAGTKIQASATEANDYFGRSVSIFGDYCIVGADGEDIGGSAYIFHRIGTNTWDAGTKIVSSDIEASDLFGSSVSIDEDYCIVGATGEDTGGSVAGAAYIFHRTGTNTWDAGTKIVASDAQAHDYFGISVSIDGDYCIVGASFEDTGGSDAGAAYIFHRTGLNTWDAGTKIVASDAEANDSFGNSVSVYGDYCIVGAFYEDAGGASNAGSAYIYHRTGTNTWDAGIKIVASDAEAGDLFGYSVSIYGDCCIVGAYRESTGGSYAGAAYAFYRTGTNTWDAGTKIVASDAEANDQFGIAVSVNKNNCIVGAFYDDDAGAVYIYKLPTY